MLICIKGPHDIKAFNGSCRQVPVATVIQAQELPLLHAHDLLPEFVGVPLELVNPPFYGCLRYWSQPLNVDCSARYRPSRQRPASHCQHHSAATSGTVPLVPTYRTELVMLFYVRIQESQPYRLFRNA